MRLREVGVGCSAQSTGALRSGCRGSLAGVLLATIPLLILFVFAGKQLVSGIMQGAVKG